MAFNEQTQQILDTFKAFMDDEEAPYMYVTGGAGTGKTTDLGHTIQYCLNNDISHCICAFTHKAVGVLASKMPDKAVLATLHSFLTKRPTINTDATKVKHVDSNTRVGSSDIVRVLFVDEFSMIGNRDYEDIQSLQWDDETGKLVTKVVFLGDLNQLPPVGDMQSINPSGDYCVHLTKVHRQSNSNPLLDTLTQLTMFIGGADPEPLEEHSTFTRGVDLVAEYFKHPSAVVLAYTNERVQELNRLIEGKSKLDVNDEVFSPTTRRMGHISHIMDKSDVQFISTIMGEILELNSKYKTLETLLKLPIQFVRIEEQVEDSIKLRTRAAVFGHKDYLNLSNDLKAKAVKANQVIERKFNVSARDWCKENSQHELSRKRAKAWREFLAFNSCVICVDFKHAMTVHKSQGSTYPIVLIDTDDLGKCADRDYKLYMQLMYVAISRASEKVFTS